MQRVLFLAAIAAVLASSSTTTTVSSLPISGQDLFVFSRAWQPGNCCDLDVPLCATPTKYMKEHLTVENLEPVNQPGHESTEGCVDYQNGHFRAGSVQQAGQADLRKYWPLVAPNVTEQWNERTSPVNPEFKYLCTGMRQVEYLQKALELAKTSKTPLALRDNIGGKASAAALRKETNGVLQCNGHVLTHVLTCWAGDLSAPIDCPDMIQERDSCSSKHVRVLAFK